jgi:hypothetical protein
MNANLFEHRADCAMLFGALLLANSHISWLCDQLDAHDSSEFIVRQLERVIAEMRGDILTPKECPLFDIAGLREQAERADIIRLAEALAQAKAHIAQLWEELEATSRLKREGSAHVLGQIAHAIGYANAVLNTPAALRQARGR